MKNILRPYNSGGGGPDTSTFINCVNGRNTQIHKLWCWDIDGICREVHPKERVEILSGTVGEFVTEYIRENGLHNHIIRELPINGIVQFIGLYQIWGSGLPYIVNLQDCVESTGWVSSVVTSSNGNPGSDTVNVICGVRFAHSTVNLSGN